MNIAIRFAIAAVAAVVSLAAFAQGPGQREAERLALFQRHASPPQRSVHYFRTDGFEYLGKDPRGNDAVALWTDVNRVYLLTLEPPCTNLQYAFSIGLTSFSGEVNARTDFVKYDHGRQCRIQTIQKVDYKALKADKANHAG